MKKCFSRKSLFALGCVLWAGASSVSAQASINSAPNLGTNIFSASTDSRSSNPHSMYIKGGILGAGLGYAYGVDRRFTLRAEATTVGRINHDRHISGSDYQFRLKNDVAMIAADYFPFDAGFRVTLGLGVRDTKVSGSSNNFDGTSLGAGESVRASVRWPTVAPYLGIGWGHHNGQANKPGWGFVADIGAYYGKPDVTLTANASALARLDAQSGGQGQARVNKELDRLNNEARKLRFFPVVQVGLSYRF